MVRRHPSVALLALAVALVVITAPAAGAKPVGATTPTAPSVTASCSGLYIGEIVAAQGIQRLKTCGFKYSGNPIKVNSIDLGVSIPPPIVFVTVIAFPGFPPKPTVIAQCASLVGCRGSGTYSPSGPLGDNLYCIFGAFSVRVTVEVAYRFTCSSGSSGLLVGARAAG